jgi:pimeloyl-ACP methyl ester carboxylesterase
MSEAIPGARLEVVPDAGHSPQRENAAAWRTAIVSFLNGVR